ncbi:MAG: DUF4209 domain-containing protein [Gammaproteobacteria bacterium]|nr:DUF4209 domain-containing protein [Gammaproteobacteria bacterium]
MDPSSLNFFLMSLDNPNAKMSELGFLQYLGGIKKESLSETEIQNLEFELLAFNFCENYDWSLPRDNRFEPMLTLKNDNGDTIVYPQEEDVTKEAIAYWSKRLKEAQHPVLKIRYASLVWEFRRQADDQKKAFEAAQSISKSVMEMVNNHLHEHEGEVPIKLKYALNTTIAIAVDNDSINQLKNTILGYEINYVKADAAINAWSVSFDYLLNHPKISLTEQEENGIIERIEERLGRLLLSSARITDLNAARGAVERLCEYYNKKEQPNKLQKTFSEYRIFICKQENLNAPAFDLDNLKKAHQLADRFNLKNDKDELALTLMGIGKNLTQNRYSYKKLNTTEAKEQIEIPPEIINAPKEICFRPLSAYIPQKESDFRGTLDTLKKTAPIFCNSQTNFVSSDGKISSAMVGTSDDENTLFYAASLFITGISTPIHHIAKCIILNHNLSIASILDYLYRGYCFHENKREIISFGLSAYLNEDPITAIHILIPQIEACLRIILEANSVPLIQKNKSDGYNFFMLDTLLLNQKTVEILGHDAAFYFRAILSHQRGLNLRNDVCHGIAEPAKFTMQNASLIFHILLILSEKTNLFFDKTSPSEIANECA